MQIGCVPCDKEGKSITKPNFDVQETFSLKVKPHEDCVVNDRSMEVHAAKSRKYALEGTYSLKISLAAVLKQIASGFLIHLYHIQIDTSRFRNEVKIYNWLVQKKKNSVQNVYLGAV